MCLGPQTGAEYERGPGEGGGAFWRGLRHHEFMTIWFRSCSTGLLEYCIDQTRVGVLGRARQSRLMYGN